MAFNYETTCECGEKVQVVEHPMGVPGGKEKEEAYCPTCNAVVAKHMIDGFLSTTIVQKKSEETEK